MLSETSSETSLSRRTSFRFVRPASVALAAIVTLALVGESSAAWLGGGGMRSFGGMRAVNTPVMRGNTLRVTRNTVRYPTRFIVKRGGDSPYPGRIGTGRYPGNTGGGKVVTYPGRTGDGKVVTNDPGRGRWPHRPPPPIWRNPGYPVVNPILPPPPGPGPVIGPVTGPVIGPGPGPVVSTGVPPTITLASTPPGGQGPSQQNQNALRAGFNPPPPGETRFVPNEVLLSVPANMTTPAFDAIAQRNRLTRLELRQFSMTGRRIARVRINDRRTVATVIRSLQTEGLTGAQPNYWFVLDQASAAAGDPTQYFYTKLHLSEAHALAKGASIRVAVVDSMIDSTHPDLAGTIAATFDATGAATKPHFHGTGVAGVIAAHGKLTGAAPSVQLLAVTAFGSRESRGNSMDILKALDWAGESKADIVNMSFTGPADPEQHVMLASLRQKGAALIAAAGNAGPKSPPLYPAADPEVIAVTATDSDDNLYDGANRGSHIAVAAPGVAILVASPDGSYQMRTGTSFAAPLVSGVAALLLERNRRLDPIAIRRILTSTAHHLGTGGQNDQFGAGLVDAKSAVESATVLSSDASATNAQPAN